MYTNSYMFLLTDLVTYIHGRRRPVIEQAAQLAVVTLVCASKIHFLIVLVVVLVDYYCWSSPWYVCIILLTTDVCGSSIIYVLVLCISAIELYEVQSPYPA